MAFRLQSTVQFIRDSFSSYYSRNPVTFPTHIERREFGFVPFGEKMQRHIGFGSYGQLNDYLRENTPFAAYYAVPYYKNPSAPTMELKGWQGADLFFDLDGDHMPRQPASFGEMLEVCKQETMRLYDSFLKADLGFADSEMRLMFSGGRGYHIHIFSEPVRQLDARARRELIDYITGTGLDAFEYEPNPMVKHNNPRVIQRNGWGDRTITTIDRWLDSIVDMGEKSARKMLKNMTPAPKPAQVKAIFKLAALDRMRDQLRQGRLVYPEAKEFFEDHLDFIVDMAGGHFDEPVTGDVKRLARLPGSLHGKTGLRATIMTRSELDEFNPLVDAVAFDEEPVRIMLPADQRVELLNRVYTLKTGVGNVPRAVAMSLILKGAAEAL
jgi:DNA primase small subunit